MDIPQLLKCCVLSHDTTLYMKLYHVVHEIVPGCTCHLYVNREGPYYSDCYATGRRDLSSAKWPMHRPFLQRVR